MPEKQASRIEVRDLTFCYPGVPIFDRFSLASEARRIVIRGPSGCGKTTLLKFLSGLLPAPKNAVLIRPLPAFTVLQSDGLPPWLSARGSIELFSMDLWRRMVASRLAPLIVPLAERRLSELSFGQRRSVELTAALLSGQPLLALDEPFNFLDRTRRDQFLAFIDDASACPSNVIMTSHYEEGSTLKGAEVFEFAGIPPYARLERVQ